MNKNLRLGLLGVALLAVSAGCSATRPRIESVSARITDIDFTGIGLEFDVAVLNPYPIPIRTPRGKYAIDIADSEFVRSDSVPSVNLPAGKVGTVTLPARMEYRQLWQTYRNLGQAAEVPYALRGALVVPLAGRDFDVPFSHEGTFPVLRPPTLSITDVKTSGASLGGASVTVEAQMKNPNVFALGLKDLGYVLQLGDVPVGDIKAATIHQIGAGETGRLTLTGRLTAADAARKLLQGGLPGPGDATLRPVGALQTPYGPVELRR